MERYRGSKIEPTPSDPSPERTGLEAEAGLEEGTWPLRLEEANLYPERPTEADCLHYLRTGFCGYGAECRFNHPPRRGPVMRAERTGAVDHPQRAGQPICQHYMRTGTCKFGVSCKFNHPKQGTVSTALVSLNYYGYPLRPGERDCSYYMKTGQCKFGATCKFHHPQPADIPVSTPFPVQHTDPVPAPFVGPVLYSVQPLSVNSSQQYGAVVTRPSLLPSYVPGPYSPVLVSPGMVYYSGWSPYQATASPTASPTVQPTTWPSSFYGTTQFSPVSSFPGPYQPPLSYLAASSGSPKEESYPQRPGQPECQHYMKTGDCKFGSSCRYHHPINLPLCPGAQICLHFQHRGSCKYGRACKFDHPMRELSYSPSASSLSNMPIAPYPVNSSPGTLAPSSSSSVLRPDRITGPTKLGSVSSRVSPSISASGASVSSVLSRDEPLQDLSKQVTNTSAIS
ncbi:hypothetical protein SAY87_030966 [Trapa incisa]|uniref:C3H1-type domain-containing protein n=1 Tax=Trapa incisa TaxID=236973 RepID=A0AAN7QKL3_9MYRT|nr:hypothetical protein SAY87_030966 [Trapa incisa]